MDNLVFQGYLKFHGKGLADEMVWTSRYYVLYAHSDKNQARLDWYTSQEDFNSELSIRKTLYLESVKNVIPDKKGKTMFKIMMKNSDVQPMSLDADCESTRKKWMTKISECAKEAANLSSQAARLSGKGVRPDEDIYEPPTKAKKFVIQIAQTEASDRCKLLGKYYLVVSAHHLSLQDLKATQTLFTWPYRLIRRYGKSNTHFNLEAGRKCDSGAGLFTFSSEDSSKIFATVQYMTQLMKESGHSPHLQRAEPSLPERGYDEAAYVSAHKPATRKTSSPLDESSKTSKPVHAKIGLHKSPSIPISPKPPPDYINKAPEPAYYDYDNSEETYATIEGEQECQYSEVGNGPKAAKSYGNSVEVYDEPLEEETVTIAQIALELARQKPRIDESDLYDHIDLKAFNRGKVFIPDNSYHLYGSMTTQTSQNDSIEVYSEIGGAGK